MATEFKKSQFDTNFSTYYDVNMVLTYYFAVYVIWTGFMTVVNSNFLCFKGNKGFLRRLDFFI